MALRGDSSQQEHGGGTWDEPRKKNVVSINNDDVMNSLLLYIQRYLFSEIKPHNSTIEVIFC
jgi:hypothetical protein